MIGFRRLWTNPRASRLRLWLFNVHLYTGLALGILVTVVGLSGSLIVYKPETERLLSSRIALVQPSGQTVSVQDLYGHVKAFRPADRIGALYTRRGPGGGW